MASITPRALTPRKKPRQARATVTLDAIFEATIQLLVSDGPHRLTTTRVAERAGVSVGAMYQYFAHKQALIYALNERYLEVLAEKIEATCEAERGAPVRRMVDALIDTYWQVKSERADVTRALYRSVVELDNEALIEAFARRVDGATAAMLASAPDAAISDLANVNRTLVTVILGTVRNAFERALPPDQADGLMRELKLVCAAYLGTVTALPEPSPHAA